MSLDGNVQPFGTIAKASMGGGGHIRSCGSPNLHRVRALTNFAGFFLPSKAALEVLKECWTALGATVARHSMALKCKIGMDHGRMR